MKSLYESILASTGSGRTSVVLKPILDFMKSLKEAGEYSGCEVCDIFIPNSNNQKRYEGVLKFRLPKSKKNTRTSQLMRAFQKTGLCSSHDLGLTNWLDLNITNLKTFDPKAYYCPLEFHVDRYWDSRIFRLDGAIVMFIMEKYPKSSVIPLYVLAVKEDNVNKIHSEVMERLKSAV